MLVNFNFDNVIILNKELVQLLGIEAALLAYILIDVKFEKEKKGETQEGGWFSIGREYIQSETTLTPHQQRNAEQIMLNNKVIEMKREGLPARNYYRFI
jgi:hypothetical protein